MDINSIKGDVMQQWYRCPNCQGPVQYGVPYCSNCGQPLYWQQPDPVRQQQYSVPPQNYQQEKPPMNNTKKIVIGLSIFAVIFLAVLGTCIGSMSNDSPTTNTGTPEEIINNIVIDELGSSNREGIDRIAAVDIVNAGYGYNIDIHFAINDNLSEQYIKYGSQMDVMDTMKALYTSSIDIQWIDMYGTFSMIDKYGNASEIEVLQCRMGKETASKINWENMTPDNLFQILDFVDWHSTFLAIE
jgi:hypothetical protein